MPAMARFRIRGALLCAAAALALTACTEDYDRGDILKMAKEETGLSHLAVSDTYEEVTGEDGYTDRLWTLSTREGMVFHMLDDYSWGMESMTNYVHSDYHAVWLAQNWPGEGPLTLASDGGGPLFRAWLEADFTTRAELEALLDAEEALIGWLEAQPQPHEVRAELHMQNPLRERTSYTVDDGDSWRTFWPDPDAGGSYAPVDREDALRKFLLTCLDYRFETQLADFTPQEIFTALRTQKDFCALAKCPTGDTENGPFEPYTDLGASRFSYGVSFGTLYKILEREGFAPAGDVWHYTFTGIDGCEYEISYDFCDWLYEDAYDGVDETGYYYYKDGVPTPMEYYFYNHFRYREIKEMTGLQLTNGSWQMLSPGVRV